ncbi:hypothetical protein BK259_13460 [Escherichia coli]|nr:hypothetical protein BK259_13460 [Escherichia coli]
MTSLKTSIKTITYLSDIGCLEIQGASLMCIRDGCLPESSLFQCVEFYRRGDCMQLLPRNCLYSFLHTLRTL